MQGFPNTLAKNQLKKSNHGVKIVVLTIVQSKRPIF